MTIDQPRLQPIGGPEEVRKTFETALFEVKRVIVGQETMLERVFVALLADGHILLEGVPGLAKTMTIKTVSDVLGGTFKRIQFTPDLVPVRPRRHAHLPAGHGPLRHRARPGVLQLPAGGRDQPRARQGAVRAARGDAGAPGHDRPRDLRGAASVPRARDAEPDRVRGHLPAARGAGRPLHVQGAWSTTRRESEEVAVVDRSLEPPPTVEKVLSPEHLIDSQRAAAEVFVDRARERVRGRALRRDARPGASTASTDLAPLHRVRRQPARLDQPDPRAAARSRCCAAAATCCPKTCASLAHDVLRHRLVLTYEALAEGVDADAILDRVRRRGDGARRSRSRARRPREQSLRTRPDARAARARARRPRRCCARST